MTSGSETTPSDAMAWATHLERKLRLAEELFEQLGAAGRKQRELVESGDAVGVLDLLKQRQDLIARISDLSEAVEPFRTRWAEVGPQLDAERRGLIQARLDSLTDAAGRIARQDEEDRRTLETKRDELARELAGVDSAKAAVSAYAEPKPVRPRFQDREG